MLEFGAFSAFVIAILLLAVVLIFMGVKTVPQGWEYTVERFGRYTVSLRPGRHGNLKSTFPFAGSMPINPPVGERLSPPANTNTRRRPCTSAGMGEA